MLTLFNLADTADMALVLSRMYLELPQPLPQAKLITTLYRRARIVSQDNPHWFAGDFSIGDSKRNFGKDTTTNIALNSISSFIGNIKAEIRRFTIGSSICNAVPDLSLSFEVESKVGPTNYPLPPTDPIFYSPLIPHD